MMPVYECRNIAQATKPLQAIDDREQRAIVGPAPARTQNERWAQRVMQKDELVWVLGFQGEQPGERLEAVVPSVDEVTHKNITCVWRVAPRLKQLLEVIELKVQGNTVRGLE